LLRAKQEKAEEKLREGTSIQSILVTMWDYIIEFHNAHG